MTSVVVTADDFGLCPETNAAICLLHDRGIVRRASLLSNTEWLEPSVEALRARPALDVAIHLNLTDGRPVSPVDDVASLLGPGGQFWGGRHYGVIARIGTGRIRREHIHREWRAQIETVRRAGLAIRQLNSHGHLHLLPHLHGIVVELMREFDIPDVRLIRSTDSARGVVLSGCSLLLERTLRRAGFRVAAPDLTIGLRTPGSIDSRMLAAIAHAPGGAVEAIVHPSQGTNRYHQRWGYAGDEVLRQLLSLERPLA